MISSWNSKIFKWQKLGRYWINPIFIFCRVILNFWVTISNPFSILLFKIFFCSFYPPLPIPVFLRTLQWIDLLFTWVATEKPNIMIFFLANIIICLAFTLSPCLSFLIWRLLISSLLQPVETFFPSNLETADILLTAACGDLLPQYLSPGGLFYVNILVKQICDKEERVKRLVKSLVFS